MSQKLMEVVVVGGSMAGLMNAIVLSDMGHKVHVIEKSSEKVLASEAAGLRAGPEVQKFIQKYLEDAEPFAKISNLLHVVNDQGALIASIASDDTMHLTTWSVLYKMLISHLLRDRTGSMVTYETDTLVQNVNYDGDRLFVRYLNTNTGIYGNLEADLVIGADGGHSAIREMVVPGLHSKYVGYVTWRGAVPESAISETSRAALSDRIVFFRTEGGYIITYHVPSEERSFEPGKCQFVWAWYEMVEEDSQKFKEMFVDISGKRHLTTIPRGKVNPLIWQKRFDKGATIMNGPLAELIEKTSLPFLSAIREVQSPKAVFHDGKLILVGDAFSRFRPHAAASTNQAAVHALGLDDVFRGKTSLEEWERVSMEYAVTTNAISIAFGEYCFTGKTRTDGENTIRLKGIGEDDQ